MKYLLTTVLAICVAAPAFAADAMYDNPASMYKENTVSNPATSFPHGVQIGVGVSGTSGLNTFIGYNNKKLDSFWWKRLGVRFDFASTKPIKSPINKGIDKVMGDGIKIGDAITVKDGALEAQHAAALIDIYPFGDTWFMGGWRLTGGYYMGKTDINATLTGDENSGAYEFKMNDVMYRYTGDVAPTAKANWRYNGPYAGTGFDIGLFGGFKIYLDAGVVFTDKAAQLDLVMPGAMDKQTGATWTPMTATEIETAKADALKEAQDKLDKYKYYPMVKLGFMYRF